MYYIFNNYFWNVLFLVMKKNNVLKDSPRKVPHETFQGEKKGL